MSESIIEDDMDYEDVYHLDTHASVAEKRAGLPTVAQRRRLPPLPGMRNAGVQALSQFSINRDIVVDQFGNQRGSTQARIGPAPLGSSGVVADMTVQQFTTSAAGFQQSAVHGGFDRVQVHVQAVRGQQPRMVDTDFEGSRTITGNEPERLPGAIPPGSSIGTFGEGPSLEQRTSGFVEEAEETIHHLLRIGFVEGCASCNSYGKHWTEDCPKLPDGKNQRDALLYHYYVVGRANLPPLVARDWNWAEKSLQMRVKNNVGWPLLRSEAFTWFNTNANHNLWKNWDYPAMKGRAEPLSIRSSAHIHNLAKLPVVEVMYIQGGSTHDRKTTTVKRHGDRHDNHDVKRRGNYQDPVSRRTMIPDNHFNGDMERPSKDKMEERRRRFGPVDAPMTQESGSSSSAGHR
ncbi:hypothetical protein DL546_008762 [Coniochaeta pulveracea]|uniref:Uncharacterized protein n=1 Tax=Coniochaeta pulveracea TaxID=177199 RepID=A0A420YEJ1_9PEZI|nr:hypothetical protein DL546_008762 [Coniochaeta pulveracea]